MIYEYQGKTYDKIPEVAGCIGCAFRGDEVGCDAAKGCMDGNGSIFVERKAPAPDEHEALTFHELPADSKPTNPKDIVGIRKAPMSTVSGPVIAELGVAMLEGAAKYGRHNYRVVGVRSSVYYDALFRHIQAWWEGEDIDPDSGMHHVTKAIATLVVLRDAMIQGKCEDDRPPPSVEFFARLNKLSGEILDRHAGKNPKHYTIQDTAV